MGGLLCSVWSSAREQCCSALSRRAQGNETGRVGANGAASIPGAWSAWAHRELRVPRVGRAGTSAARGTGLLACTPRGHGVAS